MENRGHLEFAGLNGRGIKVAVVDSGIDLFHPRIGRVEGGVDLSLGPRGEVCRGVALVDRSGHGTACAGVIRRLAPEAALYSVRLFDESLETDGRLLVAAIRWTLEAGMDVVNLSLGTVEAALREPLQEACQEAARAGVILVAAAHEQGRESYPAWFPEVIGVRGGQVRGRYGYYYHRGEAVECTARGDEQRLCWRDGKEVVLAGSSFAAPRIAGIAALIRQALPEAGVEQVRQALEANALEPVSPVAVRLPGPRSREEDPRGWIRRAALYPFAKEMHALVRFPDLLDFAIAGIADPAGKGLVGRDAGEAIGAGPVGLRIVPSLEQACQGADTLVLGHVDQLGRIRRRDGLRECVEKALGLGLHVFSLGPVWPELYKDLHEQARCRGLELRFPQIPVGEVAQVVHQARAAGEVAAPVLGVFGTSASQGKFTVQLLLRRHLLRRGYQVAQVGTEPHAELFGMDLTFPMGYESPLDLPLQQYLPYLDSQLRLLGARRRPDLIVVGAQSGTIPYDIGDPRTHSLPSLAFLLGTRPDACILVVNSIDAETYIQDTLDALRSVGKAPVLMLAMGDQEKELRTTWGRRWIASRRMGPDQVGGHLRRLEDRFGLPAVGILSEEGQERMVETVIRYFAAEVDTWQKARA